MRLPDTAHISRHWRIHELTRDFRLEDVWALPTPGGPGDFPRLVRTDRIGRPVAPVPRGVRTLWAIGGRSESSSAGTTPTPGSAMR
jgi:hypothetical protein